MNNTQIIYNTAVNEKDSTFKIYFHVLRFNDASNISSFELNYFSVADKPSLFSVCWLFSVYLCVVLFYFQQFLLYGGLKMKKIVPHIYLKKATMDVL